MIIYHSKTYLNIFFTIASLILSGSCRNNGTLLEQVSSYHSNIHFNNRIKDTKDFNILKYLYFYNGGGVGIGDFNNDGLMDIYFTANRLSNKLYLNKGNLVFEDITAQAGIEKDGYWSTGVSIVDINGDGWLDIYVCELSDYEDIESTNKLYINQRNLKFSEESEDYGLNLRGFCTQSAFFDYDLDGDLDMYLLKHSSHSLGTYADTSLRSKKSELAGDKLYRHDIVSKKSYFNDVTEESGIRSSILGYGLDLLVSDINGDGWQDIYVCNDFHENDYMYINQKNGTFLDLLPQIIDYTSRFSMSADIADFNNDGFIDIVNLDMKPRDPYILKKSAGHDPYHIAFMKKKYGYAPQYARNTLQLNRGDGNFSEIAHLSGIDATDWSWSALFVDLNNDGWKDLYIANGIFKRPNDLDYVKYTSKA